MTSVSDTISVKLFIDPTVVIASTKCNYDALDRLDPAFRNPSPSSDGRSSDQTRLPYLLDCRPNTEFGYESARKKLINLRIGQVGGPNVTYVVPGDVVTQGLDNQENATSSTGRQEHLLRLSSWINTESRLTVGCAGAVISHLQRRRALMLLPGDPNAVNMFPVRSIEMFSLSAFMFINADALLSLQITSTESHPNAQQQGPASKNLSRGAKEGLSVYGMFHHLAKTTQGRHLLRQYFLRPSQNLDVINERFNTVSVLTRTDNSVELDRFSAALAKMKNMRVAMMNLRKGISSGSNKRYGLAATMWQTLRDFLFSALLITDIFRDTEGSNRLAIRQKILEKFERRSLAEMGKLICEIVDFESSRDQRRTIILPGVDEELDEIKRTYEGIDDMLSQVAHHIAGQVPAGFNSSLNVIYFPQIGFLVSMALGEGFVAGAYEGSDNDRWDNVFVTESHAYYKNATMTGLDQRFGDIYGHICDKEIDITQALAKRILESEELLNTISDVCAELDCLVALARGAQMYNLVRPKMTEENVVKIKGGRHPLQEFTTSSYVPNDTFIVGGIGNDTPYELPQRHAAGPSMVLMTGPNYSGKSVYLKQVAIIVYMAHIGSFVPAEAAKIGRTDKIMTRIRTGESVSRIQSAFLIDLQQISMALNLATRRSLVIIDEFGKGTESNDGAGLAAGVFEHFLGRGSECPKVLGATHFHEIFEGGFMKPRPSLAFAHMEVKVDAKAFDDDDRITYLYNYCSGRSNSSYGTRCAAMNGIAQEVVSRAEKLVQLTARGENLVEICGQLHDTDLAELAEAVSSENYLCPRTKLILS